MAMLFIPGLEKKAMKHIHEGSRICFIQDYCTNREAEVGKPFSDSETSLLAQCLGPLGISGSDCSVLYVIQEPCLQTDIGKYWTPKGGFTIEGCIHRDMLRDAMEDIDANIFVPLGEIALQAITNKRGINKWRGSIMESSLVPGRKVIPTLSPRTAIKQYLYRYYMQSDFKRIMRESYYPDIRLPQRTLLVSPTFEEALAFLDKVKESEIFAWDIETARGEISCISFAIANDLCMSIPTDNRWTLEEEMVLWRKMANILEDPEIDKILQNAMFDMFFSLIRNKILTKGYIHDIMIKHNLNYPDFPKGLGFITSIYTDEPYYKDDGKQWFTDLKAGTAGDINQFYVYNAKDSAVAFEANKEISRELEVQGNQDAYDLARRLMQPLMFMQLIGIKVDKEKLEKVRTEAKEHLVEVQNKLNEMVGFDFNVNSPTACKNFFYNIKKYAPITKQTKDKATGTRKASITTDNKAMKKLAKKYNSEEARLVQQIRGLRKLISTYLEMEFDADGRIRCSYNIAGTNSGRLASSQTIQKTGANLQNLPKSFREFLVADEGMICFEIDLSQAEWVATAYISGDQKMIEAVEGGLDAHVHTGHLMFNAPKELIEAEDSALGSDTDEENIKKVRSEKFPEIFQYYPLPDMSIRQAGKKSNHSFNYGLSPNGFSLNYNLELKHGKRCHNLYHTAYPGLRIWHQHIRYQLGKDRTLENLFGRKRRFLDRWSDDLFKAAYSYPPQSTVGQLLNIGLIEAYEGQDTHEILRPLYLLNQVHDSMWGQYPLDKLNDLAKTFEFIRNSLQRKLYANGREFVIKCDCKVGFNFRKMEKVEIQGTAEEIAESLKKAANKIIELTYENDTNKLNELLELIDEEEDENSEVEG